MENQDLDSQPVFLHAEPVLAVKNITETLAYWHEILGFPQMWTWGDPPDHGGVYWNDVFIQFTLNPQLASVSKGNSIWIKVKNLQALYLFHQEKNVNIIMPIENKPWGMSQYVIQEINGYYVSFSSAITDREPGKNQFPDQIKIVDRVPSVEEYKKLIKSVGWSSAVTDETIADQLSKLIFAVVAENTLTGEAIGCAFLLGDNSSFYYVKDVMVHPDFQKQRVGTAIMRRLSGWLDSNGQDGAMVGLFTGENLAGFYSQIGFSKAFGMNKTIRRK
ncbi:Acetyltransferase (GNAT) domain-containing protein [Dyadobacter koreensis]|uniref:Acetyltransferase (GNAT) domain-containing protein n=1 Tax=Dyadobacter koreensis TaxID=408657 RepID=A0A1H6WZA8_9BACT|nr:GNAT family N-acetyltransferase [Dyadobacter koreensis]SEJ19667.1 Acetyltransferase (GNAT) domain-containing protein [Dyadobacter koreensis]